MSKAVLTDVRLSFPDLYEAQEYEGKRRYRASFLIVPGSANDKLVQKTMLEVATEKFKDKATAILKAAIAGGNQKCSYWDGNLKEYDGYADMKVVTSTREESKGRPLVLDTNKTPLSPADGKPYAGCYVDASVEFWAQDNKHGKTVRCTLLGVRFRRDGDAFSAGSVADESDFEDISDTGESNSDMPLA